MKPTTQENYLEAQDFGEGPPKTLLTVRNLAIGSIGLALVAGGSYLAYSMAKATKNTETITSNVVPVVPVAPVVNVNPNTGADGSKGSGVLTGPVVDPNTKKSEKKTPGTGADGSKGLTDPADPVDGPKKSENKVSNTGASGPEASYGLADPVVDPTRTPENSGVVNEIVKTSVVPEDGSISSSSMPGGKGGKGGRVGGRRGGNKTGTGTGTGSNAGAVFGIAGLSHKQLRKLRQLREKNGLEAQLNDPEIH